jgi:hypothetical protein
MRGGFTLGLEVEGTLCVREPDVRDVVSRPLCKEWGSLKHPPRQHLRLASCNSKPKACFFLKSRFPEIPRNMISFNRNLSFQSARYFI